MGKADEASENEDTGEESFRLLFDEDSSGNVSSVHTTKEYNERPEDIQLVLKGLHGISAGESHNRTEFRDRENSR